MRPGKLRHRVTIEQPPGVDTVDAAGQPSTTWSTFLGPAYAEIRPVTVAERIAAQATQSAVSHVVTMRYRADKVVTSKMRVVYEGRLFNILGVVNVGEMNEAWELQCEEGLRS